MAGSLTWRQYETDNGSIFTIKMDKSNANFISFFTGELLCEPRTFNWQQLPKLIKPRVVYAYNSLNKRERKSFIVGNVKAFKEDRFYYGASILQTSVTGGTFWIITGYRGERIRDMPKYFNQEDTGLTDGTPSQ